MPFIQSAGGTYTILARSATSGLLRGGVAYTSPNPPLSPPPAPLATSPITVTGVSSRWVTTGDTLSFTLSAAAQVTSVSIEGAPCAISTGSYGQSVSCVVGAAPAAVPQTTSPVSCIVIGNACAWTSVGYVFRWSNPSTWAGTVPAAGSTVSIPIGMRVLLDVSTTLELLSVEGALVVADMAGGVSLTAAYVVVRLGGAFKAHIPTPSNSFVLTLTGGLELPVFGQKVFAVSEGSVVLRGASVGKGWTQLTVDAPANATAITVAANVSAWPVGAEIAIAPSGMGAGGTEVFTIVSVHGQTITLNGSLAAARSGSNISGIDQRAEVALLWRNVVIQAEDTGDRIGAHLMLARESPYPVSADLMDVMFLRGGQDGQLGRYPVHPHMLGNVSGLVSVQHCVVRTSFNRAFTVHGVHGMVLAGNVAFDIAGHAFFLEDGTETENTLINNLALSVHPQFDMLATDTVPGGFWITNVNNVFTGNVAADVTLGQGFWIDPQLGAFVLSAPDPTTAPLGLFADNRAHSVDQYGVRGLMQGTPGTSQLLRFSAYGCAVSGFIGVFMGNVQLVDFAIESGGTAALEVIEAANMGHGGVFGGTFSSGVPGSFGVVVPGFLDGWSVFGASFSGFSTGAAISTCDHCSWVNSETQGVAVTHLYGLTVDSMSVPYSWGAPAKAILRDESGYLVADWPHLRCPAGTVASWCCLGTAYAGQLRCPTGAAGIAVFGFSECSIEYVGATISATVPGAVASSVEYGDNMKRCPTSGWAAVISAGTEWAFELDSGDWSPGPLESGGVNVEIDDLAAGAFVIVRLHTTITYLDWNVHAPAVEHYGRQSEDTCGDAVAGTLLSKAPVGTEAHGSYYFDSSTGYVHILFIGAGEGRSRTLRATPMWCPRTGCVGPPAVPMAKTLATISAPIRSGVNATVPFDSVYYLNGNLVVNGTLFVIGALRVAGPSTITAANIVVYGEFTSVGFPLRIVLTGTTPVALSIMVQETGGTLMCFGTCTLTGTPQVAWTRLTGASGSTISLAKPVAWAVGDKIAISNGQSYTIHTITSNSGSLSVSPAPSVALGSLSALAHGLSLDTRPEVALLNRTVQIFGSPRCRVLVTQLKVLNNTFTGNATFTNVAMHACGLPPSDEEEAFDVGRMVLPEAGECTVCPLPDLPPACTAVLTSCAVVESPGGATYASKALAFALVDSAIVGSVGTAVQVADPGMKARATYEE